MERTKPSSTSTHSTPMISLSQCNNNTTRNNFNIINQLQELQQDPAHKKQNSNQQDEEDTSVAHKSPPDLPQHKSKRGRKKKRKLKSVVEEEEEEEQGQGNQNPVGVNGGSDVLLKGRATSRRSVAGISSGSPKSLEGDGRSSFNKKEKQAQSQEVAELISDKVAEQQAATPIPARNILDLALDKLQKKDKYEVFAEPVDPEEVPDYYDYIKNPMDFSTIRKKLAKGIYTSLEQFEKDVFLICSNAMSYNASSTVYYRHARVIQDLAKKCFEMLRLDPENIEFEYKSPSVSKAGYSTKRIANGFPSQKLPLESAGSELASGPTAASNGNNTNLRDTSLHDLVKIKKGDTSERPGIGYEYYSNGTVFQRHHSTDDNSSAVESKADQSEVFAVAALKVRNVKDGRRALSWEEERRETYRPRNLLANGDESIFANLGGESKRLVPIGIQLECTYAKSLARFSADLGPVARKIAAQKIKRAWTAVVTSFPQHNGDLKSALHLSSVEKNKSQPKPQTSVALHTNKDNNRFNHVLANQLNRNEGFIRKGISEGQLNQLTSTVNLATNSNVYHQSVNCLSSSNPQPVQLNSFRKLSTELPFEGTKQIDKTSADLITTGAKFPTEVSQSRLLEMVSRNNRPMQWTPTKQTDGRQPGMNFRLNDSGGAVIERGGPRETFDTSKLPTRSSITNLAGSTGNTSINDYQVSSLAVSAARNDSENFTMMDFNQPATSDKSDMFLPLKHMAPNRSVNNSQVSASSAGPIMTEEYNPMQPCGQSRTADMAHQDCSPRPTHGTVPIGSSTHLNLQQQEPQVRPSCSISQLMQQKMLLGMSSYLQSQLSRMNPQNSSMLVQNISDGHKEQIFEAHNISNTVGPSTNGKSLGGNDSPQPHLNPLKGAHPQEHFHKISDLSPVRQSPETSSHSQQPDLALQL